MFDYFIFVLIKYVNIKKERYLINIKMWAHA